MGTGCPAVRGLFWWGNQAWPRPPGRLLPRCTGAQLCSPGTLGHHFIPHWALLSLWSYSATEPWEPVPSRPGRAPGSNRQQLRPPVLGTAALPPFSGAALPSLGAGTAQLRGDLSVRSLSQFVPVSCPLQLSTAHPVAAAGHTASTVLRGLLPCHFGVPLLLGASLPFWVSKGSIPDGGSRCPATAASCRGSGAT